MFKFKYLSRKEKILFVIRIVLSIVIGIFSFFVFRSLFMLAASASEASEPVQQGASTFSACNHYWDDNYVCINCGISCSHGQYDDQGVCLTCGHPCAGAFDVGSGHVHSFFGNNGICKKCGYKCQHSNKSLLRYEQNEPPVNHKAIYHCNICGLNDVTIFESHSGVSCNCLKCGVYHIWIEGVCYTCGAVCDHSEMLAPLKNCPTCNFCAGGHTYQNGICKYCGHECDHSETTSYYECSNASYHVHTLQCDSCYSVLYTGSLEHTVTSKRYVYDEYACHNIYYYCDICDSEFDSKTGFCEYDSNYTCTLCEHVCSHDYDDGICRYCLKTCSHDQSLLYAVVNDNITHSVYDECSDCGNIFLFDDSEPHIDDGTGFCYLCGYQCAHDFVASECQLCSFVCQHRYIGGRCTTCGWSCDGGHSYVDGSGALTGGVCRYCKYVCQHSEQGTRIKSNGSDSHRFDTECFLCGTIFNTYSEPHIFTYQGLQEAVPLSLSRSGSSDPEGDYCVCLVCNYLNDHSKSSFTVLSVDSLNSIYHCTTYKRSCCGNEWTEIEAHAFVDGSDRDFKCIDCGAYCISAENYYDIGYNFGLADGSTKDTGDLAQSLIFSLYDGMSFTFLSLTDYDVLNLNIASLIVSFACLVLVYFVLKRFLK